MFLATFGLFAADEAGGHVERVRRVEGHARQNRGSHLIGNQLWKGLSWGWWWLRWWLLLRDFLYVGLFFVTAFSGRGGQVLLVEQCHVEVQMILALLSSAIKSL